MLFQNNLDDIKNSIETFLDIIEKKLNDINKKNKGRA
jgi:hypothetical protein